MIPRFPRPETSHTDQIHARDVARSIRHRTRMFRPVAEHRPSIEHDSIPIRPSDRVTRMLVLECIRELEAAGRPKWDVNLRCKAKVAGASFGSCDPSLGSKRTRSQIKAL